MAPWPKRAQQCKWAAVLLFVSGLVALIWCSQAPVLLFPGFGLLWLSLVAGVAAVYCLERARTPPDVEELVRRRSKNLKRFARERMEKAEGGR